MPVSINGGPLLACRWVVQGGNNPADDVSWSVDVQAEIDALVPIVGLIPVAVRFATPYGLARGQARMTRVVIDMTRTPPAYGTLSGIGQLQIRPAEEP